MDADTFRQRRNLMITSCVLWFLCFAQVRAIDKATIFTFGVTVNIARPHAIFIVVWVLFGYFFVRYSIYALNKDQGRVVSNFWGRMNNVCERVLITQSKKKTGFRSINGFQGHLPDAPTLLREGRYEVRPTDGITGRVETVQIEVSRKGLIGRFVLEVMHFLMLDAMITDFVLPFVLAGGVLWYAGLGDWGGSFSSLAEAVRRPTH